MALQSASVKELIAELSGRMDITESDQDALTELTRTPVMVQALQSRVLSHALQMDLADMLDSPAQLEAMRLWLPMDGLDDEALWNSMSEKGRGHHLRTSLVAVLNQLRNDAVDHLRE